MVDVFISYSRKDLDFIRNLCEKLEEYNLKIWVDLEGIYAGEEYWSKICSGIEDANAFLFVITPSSVVSEYCRREIDHALKHNKRILPILHSDVNTELLHPAVASRQWMFIRENDDFDSAIKNLSEAIGTDTNWVRAHTRLLTRAVEWDSKKRDNSFLLQGTDLQGGEEWLAQSAKKEPRPTELQTQYILASRNAATKRQRTTLGAVAFALVVAIVLAVLAWLQRDHAIRQAKIARSRELATNAMSQLPVDPELSVLLATEAVHNARTTQAETALKKSLIESRVRAVMRGHQGELTSAAFSPDGNWVVVAGRDAVARLWEVKTGKISAPLEIRQERANTLSKELFNPKAAFGTDGKYILFGGSVITAFDAEASKLEKDATGETIELPGQTDEVYSVMFSPDARWIMTLSRNKTGRVWEANIEQGIATLCKTIENVNIAAFSPDSKFVATASEDEVAIWEVNTWHEVAEVPENSLFWDTLAISAGGEFLVVSGRIVWEVDRRKKLAEMDGHTTRVLSSAFSPDGKFLVTTGQDNTVRIWETNGWRSVAVLRGHTDDVSSAEFSPNGKSVVTASYDGTARVWDVPDVPTEETGAVESVDLLRSELVKERDLAISPDGKLKVIDSFDPFKPENSGNYIVEVSTGRRVTELSKHTNLITSVSFSPDGKLLVTTGSDPRAQSSDVTAQVWKEIDGKWQPVAEIGLSDSAHDAAISQDGELIAMVGHDETRVWKQKDGKWQSVAKLPVNSALSQLGTFSPDGRLLVEVYKNTAWVWDIEVGLNLAVLSGESGVMTDGVFGPDNKSITITNKDGTSRVYACELCGSIEDLLVLAQTRVTRALTPDEREKYLHEPQPK